MMLQAQYGLVLLEEKEQLEIRCDELETLYETTRHELDATREALARYHESQQESTRTGIEHEETLLHESALRESSLNTQVINMEMELKQAKAEVQRLRTEKDRLEQEYNDLTKTKDVTTVEVRGMRSELKDFKMREARLMSDFTELEEENINLQKQVSVLRTAQIEFEGYKHEIRHLQEEVDVYKHQVGELTNLKRIAEKQLEEALESLQAEREQRYNLKKEMDIKFNNETMYQLGNLALSMHGKLDDQDDLEPVATPCEPKPPPGVQDEMSAAPEAGGDHLFGEIHLNELKKLEKQLESSEAERAAMGAKLKEAQAAMDRLKEDLGTQLARTAQMEAHLTTFLNTYNIDDEVTQLLQASLKKEDKQSSSANKMQDMVSSLSGNLAEVEQKNIHLQHDIRILEKVSSDCMRALGGTQKEMGGLQEELAHLYAKVCQSNHQTPSRIMTLEHIRQQQRQGCEDDVVRNVLAKLRTAKGHFEPEEENINPIAVQNNVETVKDQVKYLRDALERLLDSAARRGFGKEVAALQAAVPEAVVAGEPEPTEQIVKLKSLLATKREQIATLRTVLKANKQTAEVALHSLKTKYDNEKTVVSETMMTLRNELRTLKEDAATFSSLRAMFAARCEEYSTQVDELSRQLSAADEERKTLNQLLRMAIHQKLTLNQRLEEIEMASEMRTTPRRPRGGASSGPSSSRGGPPAPRGFNKPSSSSREQP
jgi:protein bicaudal D